jgi:hypothetical protein
MWFTGSGLCRFPAIPDLCGLSHRSAYRSGSIMYLSHKLQSTFRCLVHENTLQSQYPCIGRSYRVDLEALIMNRTCLAEDI